MVICHQAPGFATVVGAINSTLVSFDNRPHAIGISARDCHPDAAYDGFGQAMSFKFLPGGTPIDRLVEAASRAAAVEAPRRAPRLPECCIQNIGIGRIKNDIDASGFGILVENLLPGL